MKIDAHQHFWRYNPARDGWITEEMSILKRNFLPEDLLPILHASKIDGCIAVQADQSEDETLFLLDLAKRCDQIKGVVGWVNLAAPNLPERLEYFSQFKKLRGFRHIAQSEPDDRFLVRDNFCRGIRRLKDFDFTYDILIYPRQLPAAIELAQRFPEQKFVLDHIAKPPIRSGEIDSWAAQIRKLAASPNVYCKLSGIITEGDWDHWRTEDFRPSLDVVFEAFGCDRLMFGSDWPVCLVAGNYRRVNGLIEEYVQAFSEDQRNRIFGLNAADFYGLGKV
jgi:L-fuconolactonase